MPSESIYQKRHGKHKGIQPVRAHQAHQDAAYAVQNKQHGPLSKPAPLTAERQQLVNAQHEQKKQPGKKNILPHGHRNNPVIRHQGIKKQETEAQLFPRAAPEQNLQPVSNDQSHGNHLKNRITCNPRIYIMKYRIPQGGKQLNQQRMHKRMMIAVPDKPARLAELA